MVGEEEEYDDMLMQVEKELKTSKVIVIVIASLMGMGMAMIDIGIVTSKVATNLVTTMMATVNVMVNVMVMIMESDGNGYVKDGIITTMRMGKMNEMSIGNEEAG